MTVEAQNPDGTPIVKSGPYNGNGVTTAFNYTFPITAIGEVKVVRQNADLTETVLVLTTDYTVTGAGNPAGGQVILNSGALLPTGAKLVLLLDMDFDQAVDYSNQGRIQLSLLEISLDKLTLAARQLREELLRAVTVDAFGTANIAQLRTNINALAAIEAQIVTVSSNIASVQSNAADIASINTNAANIVAIQNASANANSAASSAAAAAASAASADFKNFGLGVTGNAALLADLDATGTGAGIYRFDGTTTGTYPTGVAAGDTGMVELWRQAGATAMMELHHATSNRVFRRRLTETVWGAWRETINVNQATAEGDIAYRGASDWVRLPKGTAGQALVMNAGATAPGWGGTVTLQSSQATTSGTAFDFTGIPAAVKRVTMLLSRVSLSGTDVFLVQLGTSGGPVTTGYVSWGSAIAASAVGGGGSASGIRIDNVAAAGGVSGRFVAERLAPGSNIWICSFNGVRLSSLPSTSDASCNSGGEIDLGAELTQIRLTRSGTNTFDSGAVGASWEL